MKNRGAFTILIIVLLSMLAAMLNGSEFYVSTFAITSMGFYVIYIIYILFNLIAARLRGKGEFGLLVLPFVGFLIVIMFFLGTDLLYKSIDRDFYEVLKGSGDNLGLIQKKSYVEMRKLIYTKQYRISRKSGCVIYRSPAYALVKREFNSCSLKYQN